jgi:undecaprenyl-diphosphatase
MHFLSSVDDAVVTYLNSFAQRSWTADYLICAAVGSNLFKGVVVLTAFWWAWFRAPENRAEQEIRPPRDILLYTILMCVPAVLIARLMALYLPFRARPIHNPALHLKLAFTLSPDTFHTWSSFPCDHAVLFFALATGFFLISRRLGWLTFLFAAVCIMLPRVYVGIHYPSDVLAGALLGVAVASTARIVNLRRVVNWPAQHLLAYSPGLFYASLFLLSYLTAVLYEPLREMASSAPVVLHNLASRL